MATVTAKGTSKKQQVQAGSALRTIPPDKAFRACRQRNGNGTETNPMTIHFQDRLQWSFVLLKIQPGTRLHLGGERKKIGERSEPRGNLGRKGWLDRRSDPFLVFFLHQGAQSRAITDIKHVEITIPYVWYGFRVSAILCSVQAPSTRTFLKPLIYPDSCGRELKLF